MRRRPGAELLAEILPRSISMGDATAGAVMIRAAEASDVSAMAAIRAQVWETQAYWERRIGAYLRGEIGAQHALQGPLPFSSPSAREP